MTAGLDAQPAPMDERLRRVDALLATHAVDEAEAALAPLVGSPETSSDPRTRADVLLRQARVWRARGRHADAEAPLRTAGELYGAANLPGELGDVLREQAGAYWSLGRQVEASHAYERAAEAYARAGRVHDQAGALRSSTYGTRPATPAARQDIRRRALALLDGLDDTEPAHRYARGTLLHDLGDAAFNDGRYAEADRAYRAAESLLDVDVENRRALSLLLTSRGRLERAHGYPDRALPFYERALALQQATGYEFGLGQTLNALAVLHQLEGRHIEARDLLQQVVERYAATAPPWRARLMRLNAAWAMLRAGDRDEAIAALDAYHAAGGGTEVGPAARLPEVDLLLAANRLPQALAVADTIVQQATRDGLAGEVRALAHLRRAMVRQRLGEASTALEDLAQASTLWEGMRRRLTASDYVKRGFAEVTARSFYPRYVQALATAGQPLRALEAAELARARAFADLLAQRLAEGWRAPLPQDAGAMRPEPSPEDLRPAAQHATSGLIRGGGVPGGMTLAAAEVAIDSLVHVTPGAADDLSRLADQERAIVVVYWQGEEDTLAWVLRPGAGLTMHRVGVDGATLTRLVTEASAAPPPVAVRGAASRGGPAGGAPRGTRDARARARLHALLIAPFAEALSKQGRLVVVPHGALGRLSFATLVDARGRYLIERASVRYAPSLTVLRQLRETARRETRIALVLGDPQVPAALAREGGLPPLPGARAEARAVAATLERQGMPARVLTGEAASESTLREEAAGATIVHVAAHGVISDAHPMASFLALAGTGGDTGGDGTLTAAEVYRLRLDAELVVLSGCRTADGPVTGDGLSGLTRAFFAAGTRSVLASHWELPDVTAARLLPAFYLAWDRDAQDKADALRKAQLLVIDQLRRGRLSVPTRFGPVTVAEHPALWGGLALIGAR